MNAHNLLTSLIILAITGPTAAETMYVPSDEELAAAADCCLLVPCFINTTTMLQIEQGLDR
jgi:hypothetical protein